VNRVPDAVADAIDAVAEAASGIDDVPDYQDPLAEALLHLRMDGMFYCRSELTAPWGLDLPPMPDCLWFHVVTNGECRLRTGDGVVRTIRAGDVVVLPHGAGHQAVDEDGAPTPMVLDLPHHYVSRHYAVLRHGGGGTPATIICGVVHLGHPAARLLLDVLPEVIHVDAAIGRAQWEWLPALLSLMATEAQTARPGGETVITRLSDILVVQAIRSWIETDPEAQTGWLRAMRDPLIGRAIALVHRDPGRDWTVAALAGEVGMSRSSLSARFTELVGQSPKQYVTRWRMHLAEDLLGDPANSIAEVAATLGYHSEAAFSRAFKRETGVAPSQARNRQSDVIALAQDLAESAQIS
jgi:AraC-like DNA-binding protein